MNQFHFFHSLSNIIDFLLLSLHLFLIFAPFQILNLDRPQLFLFLQIPYQVLLAEFFHPLIFFPLSVLPVSFCL
jgi:hypothetical protein